MIVRAVIISSQQFLAHFSIANFKNQLVKAGAPRSAQKLGPQPWPIGPPSWPKPTPPTRKKRERKKRQNLKLLKNREDSSDFDNFRTKRMVSAHPMFWKFFARTSRTKRFRKIQIENFGKIFMDHVRIEVISTPSYHVRRFVRSCCDHDHDRDCWDHGPSWCEPIPLRLLPWLQSQLFW